MKKRNKPFTANPGALRDVRRRQLREIDVATVREMKESGQLDWERRYEPAYVTREARKAGISLSRFIKAIDAIGEINGK